MSAEPIKKTITQFEKKDIVRLRLISQQLAEPKSQSVQSLVSFMGALQAQDFSMVKWAIGIRLNNSTLLDVETAFNSGEIIRTHLLRPTWHMVTVNDLPWLLELTAPNIKASMKSRNNRLGLNEEILRTSNKVIQGVLESRDNASREELIAELEKAKLSTDDNRASHFLFIAELEGIACSGPIRNGKPTYALFDKRVAKHNRLTRDEALATLARKYFRSRGPARLADFTWWSGLPAKDVKIGIESIKSDLCSRTIDSMEYLSYGSTELSHQKGGTTFLLPAFDEFIISYRDRSIFLPELKFSHIISDNGIFRPTIVIDGKVIGIWKTVNKEGAITLNIRLFEDFPDSNRTILEKAVKRFGEFSNKPIELLYSKMD